MKYYSDITNKVYDTQESLLAAEKEQSDKKALQERKNEERAARAKEVEEAYKAQLDARANYERLLKDFCKDYGYFHTTISNDDVDNLISRLWMWPW